QRDLGRAAQRFGEGAVTAFAKRRQKMFEKGMAKKAERDALRRGTSSIPPPPQEDSGPSSESYDVDFDDADVVEAPALPPPVEHGPLSLDLDTRERPKPARPALSSTPSV